MSDRPTFPAGLVIQTSSDIPPLAPASVADADARHPVHETLDRCHARLRPVFGPTQFRIPDLSGFYRVTAGDGEAVGQAAEQLRALVGDDGIEAVYTSSELDLPVYWPPDAAELPAAAEEPPTTEYRQGQGYLLAAPGGIDVEFARSVVGGQGTGVRVVDIEGSWNFTHEDLIQNFYGNMAGTPKDDRQWRNHGTAVLGVMGGDLNPFGVTGVCPDASLRTLSVFGLAGGVAQAIRLAADSLRPGDIIVLELHQPGPAIDAAKGSQYGYVPVEYFPDAFAAIRYATHVRGVIVVEAGGNGSQQLDDQRHADGMAGFPPGWVNPFAKNGPDSGAILVGAGGPPGRGDQEPDASRMHFSNYCGRFDAQGWGANVVTTGGFWDREGDLAGGPDENRWYTRAFSGTSSATPIVAGALACVQGWLRAAGKEPLTPAQARQALRDTGTEQTAAPGRAASQVIGRRPDLKLLHEWVFGTERRKTTQQPRRSKPMRIQIIIEDGDVSVNGDEPRKPVTIGPTPKGGEWAAQWRGPGYFLTPQEAADVNVPGAQEFLDEQNT